MYFKVTVDFMVKEDDAQKAKEKLDGMMKHTLLPVYNIRPETESVG